jgi:hypothetical protein
MGLLSGIVYVINTIKVIEISIWIHIVVQGVFIIKIVNVVDKNYNIKNIRNIRVYKNLYLKYYWK